ncbi:MAG: hypothetical protein HOM21_17645, partial [Halobacteriovoraceae bacterium]|nr:hypothetical protein [Halobacteriovoraceae bacterium]
NSLINLLEGTTLEMGSHFMRLRDGKEVESNNFTLEWGGIFVEFNNWGKNEELSIDTPVAEVALRGTQFLVEYSKDIESFKAAVISGSIEVIDKEDSGAQVSFLKAGYAVAVSKDFGVKKGPINTILGKLDWLKITQGILSTGEINSKLKKMKVKQRKHQRRQREKRLADQTEVIEKSKGDGAGDSEVSPSGLAKYNPFNKVKDVKKRLDKSIGDRLKAQKKVMDQPDF